MDKNSAPQRGPDLGNSGISARKQTLDAQAYQQYPRQHNQVVNRGEPVPKIIKHFNSYYQPYPFLVQPRCVGKRKWSE